MIYVRDINSQDYTGAMTESVEALRLTSDEIGDLATVITKGTQSDAAQARERVVPCTAKNNTRIPSILF